MNANQPESSDLLLPLALHLPGWYAQSHRDLPWRENPDPYRIWISEIMLQQTRVEAVRDYFIRFVGELPDVSSLAAVSEERLLKLWEGLGYYSRARNLQKAARMICESYGGVVPSRPEELLSLPGIGPYTAGAIASIAFHVATPAVDGNVLRVYARFAADHTDICDPAHKKRVTTLLSGIIPPENPGQFNQALMELGATVCLPNGKPLCALCPLAGECAGLRQNIAEQLPRKTAKAARKTEQKTVFLLMRGELLAVRKRPARGLLAGLWELPWIAGYADAREAVAAVREWGLTPLRMEPAGNCRHIFTHLEWEMQGYYVTIEEAADCPPLFWADEAALSEQYALPSAFSYFLRGWQTKQKGF